MNKNIRFLFLLLLTSFELLAQSPTNLTTNVALIAPAQTDFAPSAFFSSTVQLMAAFNAARRAEEIQLGLAVNSLGFLVLPANYSTFSPTERGLYLINQERMARAGVVYPGTTAVLGLPLEGLETSLTATAQAHTNDMVANNFFAHVSPTTGLSPFDRVNATYPAACQTPMGYSENIYVACTSSAVTPTYLVEQAIFSWIYRDSGSAWGHRKALLIQNDDIYLAPPPNTLRGFVNDHGSAASEGFLGIGIASSAVGAYSGACSGSFAGHVVVMNIADPTANASCTFLTSSPLPVRLSYFSGASRQGKAVLSWSSHWEKDNQGFEVLKSRNALNWEKIGYVEGNGTSEKTNTYSWTDEEVQNGAIYYYKLRQLDFNGQFEDSKPVAIRIEDVANQVYLYPNPSLDGQFQIVTSTPDQAEVRLYSLAGAEIPIRIKRLPNQLSIVVRDPLPMGVYHVRISDNLKPPRTLRLLIGNR